MKAMKEVSENSIFGAKMFLVFSFQVYSPCLQTPLINCSSLSHGAKVQPWNCCPHSSPKQLLPIS